MDMNSNIGYLLHHLAFTLDRQSDEILQNHLDMGFSQLKILMGVRLHDGLRQKQIAHALGQTEASISRQVKLMSEMGLLTSKVSPKNRREHIVTLTAKGEGVSEKALQLLNSYHQPMFERLSEHQQEGLKEALQAMHTEACQHGRAGACNFTTLTTN